MWYVCDVLYAVLYVRVSWFVVRGCAVSIRYITVCYCDMFSVVNVYLDHLKFCVVYIDGRRYVCCSECNVVSNEYNEPTSCLVQPIGTHGGKVVYFGCVCFRGELGLLNCDDICMCVVNKHFEILEFGSKRHSLRAVKLSQWSQTAVQIVLNLPAPNNGGPIYLLGGKRSMRTRWMADAAPHKSGRCRD